MRLIFITLLALALATAVGLGSTYMTSTRGTDLGTLTIGAWTARPKSGSSDIDPYSRASIARSGELPIGTGDGIAFSATSDDKKKPLDGRCDVVVSGVTPGGPVLDADAVRPQGPSGRQFAATLRLHQPGNRPRLRRRVRDPRGGAIAGRQLAADRRHRALRADAAALRYAGWRGDADAARRADALHLDGELPMIRLLFTIIAGVLLGGVVHLVSVLALPRIATQDAYSRLTPMTKENAVTALPLAEPNNAPMPFMDPAFAVAICRYDLSGGPLKLTVPVSQAYTSVSFYTRNEVAYYAINDRSAGRKVIELDLMTEDQHSALPEDEEVTAADRLIIDSPTATGLIVLKALAPEPGLMPQAQASLAASQCTVQTEPPPAKQPEPAAPAPAPAPAPKGKR